MIETTSARPHAIDHVTVGVGPEGLAISPNGNWVVTSLLQGSGLKANAWNHTQNGAMVLLSMGVGGQMKLVNTLPAGGLPEGIAFDPRAGAVG